MKTRYKIGKLPKTLIGMDILAGVLNFINWILDFNILRLELALAFGALALLVYQLERAYIHIRWQNTIMGLSLEGKNV